jgi:hypothetical protein
MFTRKDAIEAIAEKFPTETIRQRDRVNGGFKDVVWTPEKRLEHFYIDLHQPHFDGLKEGALGLDEEEAADFLRVVENNYKDSNGLPR